jgi:DNA-binding protein YbaB
MTDPDQLIADYERQIEIAQQKAEQIRDGLDAVRITERTGDGQVAVTVDATGNVVDLRLADGELAQDILRTLRRAQSRIAAEVHTRLADTAPPETLAELENQYRTAYPAPADEPKDQPRRTLRVGAGEEPPAERPQPRRPRPQPQDDADYGDRNLLR